MAQPHRNKLISFMQTVGIICVVVGHSFAGQPNFPLRQWLVSFEMPLFMAISGCLAAYTLRRKNILLADLTLWGRNGYLTRKARRLLLPYFIISSFTFPLKALMGSMAMRSVDFTFYGYIHQLIFPIQNVIIFFWFLPTLFLIFCIWCYGAKLVRRYNIRINTVLLLIVLAALNAINPLEHFQLFCIGRAIAYLVFFGLGYFCVDVLSSIERRNDVGTILTVTFTLSILLVLIPYFSGRVVFTAFNGIIMVLAASVLYKRSGGKWLDWLFGSTYAIYLFSWFPQTFCQQVMGSMFHIPWQICSLAAAVSGILLPWLLWKYVLQPLKIKI